MDNQMLELISVVIDPLIVGYGDLHLKFHLSTNLYTDALMFCENEKYLTEIQSYSQEEIAETNKLNGAYLYPRDIDSIQHILISNARDDLHKSYLSTAAHEVKHAINNTDFCKKYCHNSFDSLLSHALLEYFNVWDEYTARKIGHRTFCTVIMPKYMCYSWSALNSKILNEEHPQQLLKLKSMTRSRFQDIKHVKETLGILARFSVWKELFNADTSQIDERLQKVMHVFDQYNTVEELNLYEIITGIEELKRAI